MFSNCPLSPINAGLYYRFLANNTQNKQGKMAADGVNHNFG
jgi:hypothetical protein